MFAVFATIGADVDLETSGRLRRSVVVWLELQGWNCMGL